MIRINIQNVEEIIFQDDKMWREIPDLRYLREQWKLSKISPILRAMGKKSLLEFLNKAKKEHENAISKYLATSVTIDNVELDLNLIEAQESLYSYFGTYRKKDKIYITFWR